MCFSHKTLFMPLHVQLGKNMVKHGVKVLIILSLYLSHTHAHLPIPSLRHHSVIASLIHLRSVFANANKHKLPRIVPTRLYADNTLTNLYALNLTPSAAEPYTKHTQSSAASLREYGQVLQCVCMCV